MQKVEMKIIKVEMQVSAKKADSLGRGETYVTLPSYKHILYWPINLCF